MQSGTAYASPNAVGALVLLGVVALGATACAEPPPAKPTATKAAPANVAPPEEANTVVPKSTPAPWVIPAQQAQKELERALVIDSRPRLAYRVGHVKGAVRADWTHFSRADEPHRGLLLPDDQLQAALRKLGVSNDLPVLVVGNPPDDWGEAGRIVWMLRAAGHTRASLVDGGHKALVAAGAEIEHIAPEVQVGDFVVRPRAELTVGRDDLRQMLDKPGTVVIDTRERREYDGATPYGEKRGGHIPGAIHVYFKDLLKSDGTLAAPDDIRAFLAEKGAQLDSPIVAYCTGGVRSGWMVTALRAAGFTGARNYAGSMWEWSAASADDFPLEK